MPRIPNKVPFLKGGCDRCCLKANITFKRSGHRKLFFLAEPELLPLRECEIPTKKKKWYCRHLCSGKTGLAFPYQQTDDRGDAISDGLTAPLSCHESRRYGDI